MEEIKVDFMKDILENWHISDHSIITRINQGVVNKNWIIDDYERKYILKEVEKSKKEKNIIFELNYLQFLKNKGFPYKIPQPIKTTDGRYFIKHQNHYYWLYGYIKGISDIELTSGHLEQIAEMLAIYHNIIEKANLDNKQPPDRIYNIRIMNELSNFLKNIKTLNKLNEEDKLLLEHGPELERILLKLSNKTYLDLSVFPIHRDLGGDNIIWNNDHLNGVIDFENVSEYNEPFIKDLSVIIRYSCRDKKYPYKTDVNSMKVLIEKYSSIKKLPNNELSYISDFLINGIIEDYNYAYWLSKNDSQRFNLSRMKRYAESAIWHFEHKEELRKTLLD